MNWGKVDKDILSWLKQERDVYYLSKHDDYQSESICCVNSDWHTRVVPATNGESTLNNQQCECCSVSCPNPRFIINCEALGQKGCHEDADGYMWFDPDTADGDAGNVAVG